MSLQGETGSGPSWPRVLQYVLYFIAWIVSIGLGLWVMTQLRVNLLDISVALNVNPWAMSAIDKFSFFILGLVWLVLILLTENYLRTAVARNLLLRRLAKVFGIGLALLAISYGLQFAFNWYILN